ncbi:beta strand repeat-containing protein [Flavobacterium cerinum]|uniref:Uncharacterized protein n=1 Tax=Flavobacterium cerinum TaxID=2502784 RepID=A0A3S3RJ41_9FLAO|nr:hypothetical protein [Flavobacterium cerinum]RWW99717.1 hypothetical protein EPI11_12250 [Flavobacterium cerinum]
MNIINTFNDKRFILNGIQYFKNYVSVVRGNKIEIFNCYERKDVLVELTHYNQFSVDGTVYTSAALLQEALLPIIYSRINMGDGSTFAQNNIGRSINLGLYLGDSSVTAIVAKMNNRTTVISATDTPVVLSLNSIFTSAEIGQSSFNNKKYLYLFRPGAGTYGIGGTTVTTTMITQLATLNLTQDDIQNDPGAIIYNIDPVTNGDYLLKANTSLWDFSDSGYINEDDSIKTYYFSYSVNDVLYFAQFKGIPGIYGLNNTPFEEEDFVATTNSGISPTPTLEQILAQGGNKNISQLTNNGDGVSPYTTVAKLNGLTITVNQAAAEMYLKNSEGTTLATVNLAFLNNEGTTFFYNQTTQKLELKNDAGIILSEVSVSAFVSNLMQTVDFNGANPSILEFKDAAGNVVDSATFTINNIAGLQAALNAKANNNGSNAAGTWPINVTGTSVSTTNWGGAVADFSTDGSVLTKAVGLDASNTAKRYTASTFKSWLSITITDIAGLFTTLADIATSLVGKANLTGGNSFSGSQTINGDFGVYGQILSDVPNGALTQKTYRNGQAVSSIGSGSNNADLNGILQLYGTPGDDVIRLYSTGDSWINGGNIGFGTKTPGAKLDVNGNINIASGNNLSWGGTYESGNPTIAANGSGIGFYPSGEDTALYITHQKNIGINKVDPLYSLDVNGIGRFKRTGVNGGGLATVGIISSDAKTANDAISQSFLGHNTLESEVSYGSISANIDSSTSGAHSGSLEFRTYNAGSSTLALKLSKEGNVGVGTLTPGTKLDVNGKGKFSGEVTIPNGTALGSAVNKSQLDLKANLNGGNTFSGDQNFNENIIASSIIVGSNDFESGYKFQVEGAFAIGTKGKARLYGGTLNPTTSFIQSRDINISQNLAIYAKNILIGSPDDSGEKFQLTGNADINGLIISKDLANDSSIKLQPGFSLPNIQGTNYAGTGVKPIIMQKHGGSVGIGIAATPTATLEVGGTGKFSGEVQIAPATLPNNAVTLGQLNAVTIDKTIEATLSLIFLAIPPGQTRGIVVTVNGVTAGDFILATTSDPIDGGQIVYARSTAENTVFIGILNGSITEQASGTRIIKIKILK